MVSGFYFFHEVSLKQIRREAADINTKSQAQMAKELQNYTPLKLLIYSYLFIIKKRRLNKKKSNLPSSLESPEIKTKQNWQQ